MNKLLQGANNINIPPRNPVVREGLIKGLRDAAVKCKELIFG